MTRILLLIMSLMLIASTVSARDDDDAKKPKAAKTDAKADSKAEAEPPGVTLNAQQIKDLGIATVAVEATALPPQVQGFAVVLDPQPLIQAAGDLSAAVAADGASRRQAERLDALYREDATVSGKDADAGRAQAAADRAKLAGLSATARMTWGNLVTGGDGTKLVHNALIYQ